MAESQRLRRVALSNVIALVVALLLSASVFAAEEEAAECSADASSANPACLEGKTFANPILADADHELADPGFLDDRPRTQSFYMYPTGDQSSYEVYISQDMVHWSKGPKVLSFDLPCPPAFLFGPWYASMTWAPDVFYDPDSKRYYLYYTRCLSVGVAVADSPTGPFTDLGTMIHLAIDAHLFRDEDGRMYFYYGKLNLLQLFSSMEHVWVQPMANATHFAPGVEPTEVLRPSEPWEFLSVGGMLAPKGINEGPWMIKLGQIYYLMYSGAGADSEHYALGYATATSPTGPFTKYASNPITAPSPQVFGPGHHAVWRDDADQFWCIYHIKKGAAAGWDRVISLDPLNIHADGSLGVNTSLGVSQPVPRISIVS